jgi:hypothetical protein
MILIRLIGTPRPRDWSHKEVVFDPDIPALEADGLLCWGHGTDELVRFAGQKGWYYPEPRRFSLRRARHFREMLRHLRADEFLHFSNSVREFAYPVATHYDSSPSRFDEVRQNEIVAIVSNFGGSLWWLNEGARRRNAFLLQPQVSLFGSPASWAQFRRFPWSRPHAPPNFRGPWGEPGLDWYMEGHVRALARYRCTLCLENSSEPHYFTEKFVNACRAGCVPVYHAHPTVRDGILRGALWIDPADHGFDPARTFAAARDADAGHIVATNLEWLQSEPVRDTNGFRIWTRIADHFATRLRAKRAVNA